MQRSVVGRTTGPGLALEIASVLYPLVSVSPLCRRNVSRKWETCHIPYVRFTLTRHTRHRPMNGQLLAELTALPLATHVTGMGCVQHPGRRENRRRRTPAQGSSADQTDGRWSGDLCCGPGVAKASGPTQKVA